MNIEELQAAIDTWDEQVDPVDDTPGDVLKVIVAAARLVANPNIKAALEARFNFIDATVESVTEIVAAAHIPPGNEQ